MKSISSPGDLKALFEKATAIEEVKKIIASEYKLLEPYYTNSDGSFNQTLYELHVKIAILRIEKYAEEAIKKAIENALVKLKQ
jgi:hypothetical protein